MGKNSNPTMFALVFWILLRNHLVGFPLGSSIFAVWLFESLDVRRPSRSCNLGCPICVDICVTGTNMETGGQIHLGFLNPATCGISFSPFLNGRGSSLWFWFQLSFICNWMKQTIKGGKKTLCRLIRTPLNRLPNPYYFRRSRKCMTSSSVLCALSTAKILVG
jgi:hypothetical protein